jgi:glycosyltransferase involved in cell wall biosynthesis
MTLELATIRDTVFGYGWLASTALRSSRGARLTAHALTDKHLLLVASIFPPRIDGGAYRPTALARHISTTGWRMTVVTGVGPKKPTEAGLHLLGQVPPSVNVLRIGEPRIRPSFHWFPRIDGSFVAALETFELAKEKLSNDPPSVVIASGPNFDRFIAAYYLSRYFRVPLVLEYRDEWTECPFTFIDVGNADRVWEARCLRRADLVVFTTRSQLEHNVARFPCGHGNRCRVVPNGWEPDDFIVTEQGSEPDSNDGRALISFVGSLGDHTLPGAFLETLEETLEANLALTKSLRLRFVGMKNKRAREQLAAFRHQVLIDQIEHMRKPDANGLMMRSDALLLFNTPAFDRYFPGKLYDYLASGRPILVYGEGGEIGRVVTELDAGIVIPESDPLALADALRRLTSDRKSSTLVDERRAIWMENHTRRACATKLVEEMEKFVASRRQ